MVKGGASDLLDFNVGGRLKLIIVYSSSTIIWGIINSTAMTQSFWQNFAILGGATFLYPVFIMLTSAVEMSWVFFKCDWHGNIRRDEPINCMYEKLFCSMRFNATSRTKNRSTVKYFFCSQDPITNLEPIGDPKFSRNLLFSFFLSKTI